MAENTRDAYVATVAEYIRQRDHTVRKLCTACVINKQAEDGRVQHFCSSSSPSHRFTHRRRSRP